VSGDSVIARIAAPASPAEVVPIFHSEIADRKTPVRSAASPISWTMCGFSSVPACSGPNGNVRIEEDQRSASHDSLVGPTMSPTIVTGMSQKTTWF
jgi:hypothetical protein